MSIQLRYGMNPHQQHATIEPIGTGSAPVRVIHGDPSYINMLDALNAWQLVREASIALGRPAATSFKHVSPAGAAIAGAIDAVMAESYHVDAADIGPLTSAYLRARDADPKSSYGDLIAVSEPVDVELAQTLRQLACDGIIAPSYAPGTLATLAAKKRGTFLVLEADDSFEPPTVETREVFGMRLTQARDDVPLTRDHLRPATGTLPPAALDDLLLGAIVLRYTQSNSVAYLRDGMTVGIGAGQQSRIDCTRLAGAKTDTWWLRRHPSVRSLPGDAGARIQDRINQQITFLDSPGLGSLGQNSLGPDSLGPDSLAADERDRWLDLLDGVAFVSDGAIPFVDNIEQARRHGVRYIAEPGGSIRTADVMAACADAGIGLVHTGVRLFHH